MSRALVEAELSKRRNTVQRQGRAPSFALVGGMESGPDVATPRNIAGPSDPQDLVTGPETLPIVSIAELRSSPEIVLQVMR